jgi:hypothetical protein
MRPTRVVASSGPGSVVNSGKNATGNKDFRILPESGADGKSVAAQVAKIRAAVHKGL